MNIAYMAKSKWTALLDAIRTKGGTTASMTVDQAISAVENITTGDDPRFDELVARTITTANGSVNIIGSYAFADCSKLESANFPNATVINPYAFSYCSNLTTANFPQVSSIWNYAFTACSNLTTANFPEATLVSNYVFMSCRGLTAASFPAAITIGNQAFSGCYNLSDVYFPVLKEVGVGAFSGCSKLTSVDFPKVESMYNSAFAYCRSLSMASFPRATRIGYSAFLGCYNLLSLYLLGGAVASLLGANAFSSTPISNYTTSTGGVNGSIYVPASLYDRYLSATNWSLYSSRFVSV